MGYLNKAYKAFSNNGLNGLTPFIEKNNSINNLNYKVLTLYIDKIDFIASSIKKKTYSYTELFDLFAEHPDELKFCKQLFIHRDTPEMNLVFLYSINAFKPILLTFLKSHSKISKNVQYYNSVWMTMVESWYSELDVNNLTAKHMKEISEKTAKIIINLNNKTKI